MSSRLPRAAAANADAAELAKFDAGASRFWDPQGEFRPLHLLNPVRTRFVSERAPLAGRARARCRLRRRPARARRLARAGARVTAIDLAPRHDRGRAPARRIGGRSRIDYRLAERGGAGAAQAPRRFDVVTCMEMLEHVPEPAAMLGTLAQLLHARRRAVRLDPQPQPQVLPPGDRRRGVPPEPDSARHARVRAPHPPGGTGALGTRGGAELQRPGRDRAQPVHRRASA